jgi:hypothetical protein
MSGRVAPSPRTPQTPDPRVPVNQPRCGSVSSHARSAGSTDLAVHATQQRCCVSLLLVLLLAGCAAKQGPDLLRVDADHYRAAFDAALEASRECGMPPALRDRRQGVIETLPLLSSTVLTPWRGDNASMSQAVENTIAFRRRRARFEFTPVGAAPADGTDEAAKEGADLLGLRAPEVDLSAYEGVLELTVRVYVDQAYNLGIRRSTWSRRSTTRARIDSPSSDKWIPQDFWTPVTRDEAFERRLLAAVDRALQPPARN